MHVTAIIAAGGRGRRLGADVPKQLLPLGGQPILQWSVEAFLRCDEVAHVVVVGPRDLVESPPEYLRVPRVAVVTGGERRQDSVALGFDAASATSDIVLVHDAARPLVDRHTIRRVIEAAAATGAAIAAMPASDTVKWSELPSEHDAGGRRLIGRTLARDAVFLAQTPQGFRRLVLAAAVALGRQGVEATDEAYLAEQAGYRVELVEGARRNMKITTRDDLVIAEALIAAGGGAEAAAPGEQHGEAATGVRADAGRRPNRSPRAFRVGSGYDLHRLVDGRPLILGGVSVPFERGLSGHSDADVLSHAITDAILGAAALGDIGQHFPDTDPRWRNASSLDLLAQVVALVRSRGFALVNVDATVIAERPKLGPHRSAIVDGLASVLGLERGSVSVKAKTNEGVDAAGRGEAIAAHAVALIEQQAGAEQG